MKGEVHSNLVRYLSVALTGLVLSSELQRGQVLPHFTAFKGYTHLGAEEAEICSAGMLPVGLSIVPHPVSDVLPISEPL